MNNLNTFEFNQCNSYTAYRTSWNGSIWLYVHKTVEQCASNTIARGSVMNQSYEKNCHSSNHVHCFRFHNTDEIMLQGLLLQINKLKNPVAFNPICIEVERISVLFTKLWVWLTHIWISMKCYKRLDIASVYSKCRNTFLNVFHWGIPSIILNMLNTICFQIIPCRKLIMLLLNCPITAVHCTRFANIALSKFYFQQIVPWEHRIISHIYWHPLRVEAELISILNIDISWKIAAQRLWFR